MGSSTIFTKKSDCHISNQNVKNQQAKTGVKQNETQRKTHGNPLEPHHGSFGICNRHRGDHTLLQSRPKGA